MKKISLKKAAKLFIAGVGSVVLLGGSSAEAAGLTQNQLNVLKQGIPYFNTEINSCTGQTASTGDSTLVGADNIEKAYNFFISKGLTPVQAAGIVGNFWWESHGVNPAIEQVPGSWQDMSGDFNHAVGIAQWDGGRRVAIINKATSDNKDVKDLAFQLDYAWTELSGNYPNVLKALKATTNATDATMTFGRGFEAPDEKQAHWDKRIGEAEALASNPSGNSASDGSACGVTCDPSGNTTVGNLSLTRQRAVCIARGELTSVWTPLPTVPRMQYTKYTDGWMCNGGAAPSGSSCPNGNEFWCADFASWVYKQAGYSFTSAKGNTVINGWRYPAVQEINDMGHADQNFHWHGAAGYTPVPGDLAIHQGSNGYSHVNIVVNVSGERIQLIGGDQGSGPYGGPVSASVVSYAYMNGSTDDSTIGYVSPD